MAEFIKINIYQLHDICIKNGVFVSGFDPKQNGGQYIDEGEAYVENGVGFILPSVLKALSLEVSTRTELTKIIYHFIRLNKAGVMGPLVIDPIQGTYGCNDTIFCINDDTGCWILKELIEMFKPEGITG